MDRDQGVRVLEIVGASEHNLKNVSVVIPKESLVVFSGVSGSGKSSLAFDTVYVEGQRKYIESLSSYARQFLGQLERPKYEKMVGLAPTVAIEQKAQSANPRSTVGTVTEILDYMRVLYARAGEQRCHQCDRPVGKQDPQQIVERLLGLGEGANVILMAPVARERKGEYRVLFEEYMKQGFTRFRIDGEIQRLEEAQVLDKKRKHNVDVVVDRIKVKDGIRERLTDSVETALKVGKGHLVVDTGSGVEGELRFSELLHCDHCDLSLPELSPQLFSFNSPLGACPSCHGLGISVELDAEKVFTNLTASLQENFKKLTVIWKGRRRGWERRFWSGLANHVGLTPGTKVFQASEEALRGALYGAGTFPGLWGFVSDDMATTQSELVRSFYGRYLRESSCRACGGERLRPEARSVRYQGRGICELTGMSAEAVLEFFRAAKPHGHVEAIAAEPTREIVNRLAFLVDVGLEYLTLDRTAHTLSGGEAQRIRLARQLGSELSGVIYILDEPSVGLHPRDSVRLVRTLERLRDLGNTVIVVEHDPETMSHADHIVDFGPGAGRQGGEVVYSGDLPGLLRCERSLTGGYLSGRLEIERPAQRRGANGELRLEGVTFRNISGMDVGIPLGCFTVVTGVSGAGKSTLVEEVLKPLLEFKLNGAKEQVEAEVGAVRGLERLDSVITVDQKPIGRTPRSNPATYTKLFDAIRSLFAATKDAKAYGYGPGRFSFNVKGGRCERCEGDGSLKIEMHFLPDVYIPCPQCLGQRFNDATLRVQYKGKSIADVLAMSVEEALEFFGAVPAARRILSTLNEVGLGYMALGQPSPTLSGGEAQRIKLARELARTGRGSTLYILDEPTTGLHFDDIRKLLSVVHRLVDSGCTVVMVEHNLDIIRSADWVIDLGPEGGGKGGKIVVEGTPEKVAECAESHTGLFLRQGGWNQPRSQ